MTTLLDRPTMPTVGQSGAAEYHAAIADARTQIATCWQSATEFARVAPGLAADTPRLPLLETLTRLLDALASLDVAVQTHPSQDAADGHMLRCRHRYAAVDFAAQQVTVAAGKLLAHGHEEAAFAYTLHTMRIALRQLRHHLDDIGHMLNEMHVRAA